MAKAKTPKQLSSHIRFLKKQIVTAEKALKKAREKKKKTTKKRAKRKTKKSRTKKRRR